MDRIPACLLKDSADIVVKPVTFIINTSLRTAKVPCDWKSAVIPLFKKGKADEMDSYRPISILPVLSKVVEQAVHIQMYGYLQQNKILSLYQCGFRKCQWNVSGMFLVEVSHSNLVFVEERLDLHTPLQ